MRNRQIKFVAVAVGILFCFFSQLFAQQTELIHFPVTDAVENRAIQISARFDIPTVSVEYIRIFFRTKGSADYRYLEMEQGVDNWIGEIPAEVVKSPGVEYFLLALMTDHSMVTSPASNPYYAPYEVTVSPAPIQEPPPTHEVKQTPATSDTTRISLQAAGIEIIVLSPEPETSIPGDEVIIALSLLGNLDTLDLQAAKLFVDNSDYTASAVQSQYVFSLTPDFLKKGSHTVSLHLKDKSGNEFEPVSWRFYVISPDKSEFQTARMEQKSYSGNFYVEYRDEKVIDSTLTTSNLGANIRGSFGKIHYRGRLFITSREKPEFQPRNRFYLEAGTKWIGVKLGDTSPRWNELILWGRRVRGLEAYLRLGFFNFEFAMGQTNRKVEGINYNEIYQQDPDNPYQFIDPTTGNVIMSTTGIYRPGTFAQNLIAFRPSFGSGENFQLGLNLVKVKDDAKSIENGIYPKDNIVLGPDLTIAADKHRFELKASAAFSLLANDISGGAISKAEFDTTIGELPFDPADYEKYFVLNESLSPIDPSKLTSLAYQTSLRFNYFGHNFFAVYKSIGSEYNSLANSFLRKDIRGFSIFDRIRLFKNQLFLNLGYENLREKLSAQDDGDPTTAPNDYGAFTVGFSFFPGKSFLPRISLNWKQYDRNNGLDTTQSVSAVNYKNRDVSVQLGYDFSIAGLSHQLNFSRIANDRMDGFDRRSSNLTNNVQMLSLRTNYSIPLTTVISYATNKNDAGEGLNGFQYQMYGINGLYNFSEGKIKLKAGWTQTNAEGTYLSWIDENGNPLTVPMEIKYTDYKRSVFKFGGVYNFYKRHEILLDANFINFNDKVAGKYSNRLIRIRYQMRY